MPNILRGLNPLSEDTNCFFRNKKEKKDGLCSQAIQGVWKDNLDVVTGIYATYLILVGKHESFAIEDKDYQDRRDNPTFKGVLDFLILPLIARRLWNWSFLKMQEKNNSLLTDLAISAARAIALPISLMRILTGVALTIILIPVVALVSLIRAGHECITADTDPYERQDIRL